MIKSIIYWRFCHTTFEQPNLDLKLSSSHHPISNVNISKTLKKLFLSHFHQYVSVFNNLNPHQSAYYQYHSTVTSLISLLDSIYSAADNSLATLLVSLDLIASFHTIDHAILLNCLLTSLGISTPSCSCLSSYLTNWSFSVSLSSFTSSSIPISCGV